MRVIDETAAHNLGAIGAEPTEFERRLFEAWMRGHCWAIAGEWNGRTYIAADEDSRRVNQHAMMTRQLWAAWRDRAALTGYAATPAAEQPDMLNVLEQAERFISGFEDDEEQEVGDLLFKLRALQLQATGAQKPASVAVPRKLLAEAESIIDSYAEALRASHAPGGDWEGEEAAQDGYEREAGVASKLRRLLAGCAE